MSYDNHESRFTYHDPWPGESLLCRDFNAAGVDARPKGGYWTISSDELERVIFAAFVRRPLWSEYMGEKYFIAYDEFGASDFWTFFHLAEVGRRGRDDGGGVLVMLKPGGFQSDIDLHVAVGREDRLVEGLLSVRRSWAIGPPFGLNPFSLDIVRSFIAALAPPPDRDAVSGLVNLFHQVNNQAHAKRLIGEGPGASPLHRALFTYLGSSPSFDMILNYSSIHMKNEVRDGDGWLQTQVTIDVP